MPVETARTAGGPRRLGRHGKEIDRIQVGATGRRAACTDGLRNITGRVNRDGTVSIWAITSTVSGNGDQGADPNKLVLITDKLAATSAARG